MPPAASAHGDPAIVVAATLARKTLGQVLDRLALVKGGAIDLHQFPGARGDRIECLQRHDFRFLSSRRPSALPRGGQISEERRVGKECVCRCLSRWSSYF